ncbi:MAG: glycosyltransferase family 2 protein [Planctomycetaceae bacterium]|nr:glycosyltransferase family 2 protein [Planctomycetaceae bacterium]
MFFALISVFFCKKRRFTQKPSQFIAILIPAHNESVGLRPVLECCHALDYPKELYSVTVIADNCHDDTARIAQECGVTCLERFDNEKRGKGEALEWALPQILENNPDAVMILDADCYLDSQSLKACDFELIRGKHVIQLPYLVSNSDVSFRSYCQSLARTMENLLFYWPKSKLGLSSFLIGSGMILHREILERFPWRSGGLNEDFEYCFNLIKNEIKPAFVGDAGLVSPFPVEADQFATQRARWIFGGLQAIWNSIGQLLRQGIFKHNFIALDAAVSMFYISRPIVFCQVALSGLLALVSFLLFPSFWSNLLLAIWGGTVVLYFLYVALGVLVLGVTWTRLKYVAYIPVFILKYFEIAAKSFLIWRPKKWERTPRKPE